MFVSTDGRTFREPPQNWTLANWNDKTTWFAGSPQSLAGDLIREGITGVSGHVSEPLLGNTIRPDILFPAYVAGFSLAEAFYLAMPSVSWMTVVVGDPLCAPFANAATTRVEDPPIDPSTELPAVFSQRRLAAATQFVSARWRSSRSSCAQTAARNAEIRPARGPISRRPLTLSQPCWERRSCSPRITRLPVTTTRRLRAIGRFCRWPPTRPWPLNNLAYALAVRKGELREALPLAERARTLAPQSGVIADTLGWIYFISGDAGRALPLLSEAARLEPGQCGDS